MGDELRLTLLGSPRAQINDTPITGFITSKAEALLYFLATTGRDHTRVALAGLLWPDVPDSVARKNLRDILSNLRKLVGNHLIITRQTLAFDVTQPHWIDSTQLCAAAHATPTAYDAAQPQAAVDLYQGEFLDGFYVRESDLFEAWVLQEREQLRTALLHILHLLAAHYVEAAAWSSGLQITQRILAMEPWDEAAHRQQMRLLAGSGQRGAALTQYEQCKALLATEFGVAPASETRVLYELIQAGTLEMRDLSTDAQLAAGQSSWATNESSVSSNLKRDLETVPQPLFFLGRQHELQALQTAVATSSKRIINVMGLGGQGKTALVAQFAAQVVQQAEPWSPAYVQSQTARNKPNEVQRILWYSCQNAPTLKEILICWLQQLAEQSFNLSTATTERLQRALLTHLRRTRCLLILDNFESFLSNEAGAGVYRREHKEMQQFLDQIISVSHQSCLMITSREQPLNLFQQGEQRIYTLQLHGMGVEDALQLLETCQIQGHPDELLELTNRYSGHPLALKMMAEAIHELFMGNLAAFLEEKTLFFDGIRNLLTQQFARLSLLEREIILWLAIARDAVTPQQIWDGLVEAPPRNHFFEAIRSLQRRALIETEERPKRFSRQISLHLTLPTVVLEYASDYLIRKISQELDEGNLQFLHRYALVRAQDPEYIRQIQIRFLLQPIAQQLTTNWGARQVEQRLDHLVAHLRQQLERNAGYAAANLLHLMQHLQICLCGKDFSGLSVRQADFRRVQLVNTDLSNTDLTDCAFADYFGAVLAVAFSPDNQLLATATTDGDIQLWRTSDWQLTGVCHGNGRWIWSLAFHPNGQQLLSGCADKELRVWDVGDFYTVRRPQLSSGGVPIRTLTGHTNAIFGVAYSADGRLFASGSADGTIRLWRTVDGTLVRVLAGHTAAVYTVAFDPTWPDGSRLASGSRDRRALLWDTTTGEVLQQFTGHTDELLALAFQPGGHHLITAAWDQTVRVWSIETGEVVTTFTDARGALLTVACHPDNDTIAAAGNDHTIYLWSLRSATLKLTLQGHIGAVGTLAFAGDGPTLASGSFDQTIRLWDSERGHELRTYHGHRNAIRPLALSPSGQWLANANMDQTICLWDMSGESHQFASNRLEPRHILQSHDGMVLCIAFHPTQEYLACAGQDGTIRLWDLTAAPTLVDAFHAQGGAIFTLAFSPDGKWLASGDTNHTVCVWDLQQGRCIHIIEGLSKLVETLLFTPDGNYLLSGCEDGNIYVYQLPGQQMSGTHPLAAIHPIEREPDRGAPQSYTQGFHNGTVTSTAEPFQVLQTATNGVNVLTVSPDGQYLAVGGAEPLIELWRLSGAQQQAAQIPVQSNPFPALREQLVSANNDHTVPIPGHPTPTQERAPAPAPVADPFQRLWTLPVVTSTFALTFSADGQYIVGAGGDHKIYLWDLVQNRQLNVLTGHTGTVFALRYDATRHRFYSSSADETIRVWERVDEEWTCTEILQPPGLYRGLNIAGASGINPEKRFALRALGAVEQPRIQVSTTPPHNLPSPLTSLYGRDEELATLLKKLSHPDTRLLAIWGEGGVGKTRLAVELARAGISSTPAPHSTSSLHSISSLHSTETRAFPSTDRFADGVWLIPLTHVAADTKPDEQLAAAIGSILNITFDRDEPLPRQLFARLQSKHLLLLLDSFEHLMGATNFLVQLLQAAPGVKLIVTSRHRLHLVAQMAHRLQGLPVPTAEEGATLSESDLLGYAGVRLFVDRMERITGSFILSPQNRHHVLTLCRLVNGLPLGIELAATQISDKGLAQVVQTIEADLMLLRSDAHDLPKEQQSLYAVFHQSWQSISADLQRILVCCAVFQGGFTLEAAHRVATADKTQVQALCDRSLLYEVGNGRYGMHDFIRSFAAQHADKTMQCDRVRTAHAMYYLQILHARGRRSYSTAEDFQILSLERDNIRAAWQWLVHNIEQASMRSHTELLHNLEQLQQGMEGFFYLYERFGHHRETEVFVTQALTVIRQQRQTIAQHAAPHTATALPGAFNLVEQVLQEVLAELLIHRATHYDRIGNVEEAEQDLTEACTLAHDAQAPHLEANALYLSATLHQQTGELTAARSLLATVEELARQHKLVRWHIAVHNLRGILLDMQGDPTHAMAQYTMALPLAVTDGDLYQERLLVNNMGLVALSTGHWEEAHQYMQRNLHLSETLGNPTRQAFALMNHALLLDTLGLYREAEQDLQKALHIAREIHHRQAEVYVLQFLALVGFHTGNSGVARHQAEESLLLIERYGLLSMKAQGLTVLAHNLLSSGETELALEHYAEAGNLWRAMGNQLDLYTAQSGYAFTAIQVGKIEEAVGAVNEIMAALDHLLAHHARGIIWIIAGCYYVLQTTNDERADELLQTGYRHVQQQAQQIKDPEIRNAFLNNVFSNRTIFRLMQNRQ